MKKLLFLIILVITQSAYAQVKETWETSFTPPWRGTSFARGMPPEDFRLFVILKIDKNTDGAFLGEMQFNGPVRCLGITKIESGKIAGDLVSFKTEPLPVIQCPHVTFSGKVVGDTWVGILPWNGKDNEVVFKKK